MVEALNDDPSKFVFVEEQCNLPDNEFDSGIQVYDEQRKSYIYAKLNQDDEQVNKELHASMLKCFCDENFNQS